MKLQLLPGDSGEPQGLDVLHRSHSGRLETLIVRGSAAGVEERLRASDVVYYDLLPLSLEEIFIYELGGISDEIRSIIL